MTFWIIHLCWNSEIISELWSNGCDKAANNPIPRTYGSSYHPRQSIISIRGTLAPSGLAELTKFATKWNITLQLTIPDDLTGLPWDVAECCKNYDDCVNDLIEKKVTDNLPRLKLEAKKLYESLVEQQVKLL